VTTDLEKLRARLRTTAAPVVEVVRAPIDEDNVSCSDCGGGGQGPFGACRTCGGSGMRYTGEPIARGVRPTKELSTAYLDGAWLDNEIQLRLTLTSDPPDASNIKACDADVVLTGPALILGSRAHEKLPAEFSVRYSTKMFKQVGVMICYGVVHSEDGLVLATFPLPRHIHSGGDHTVKFKIDMDETTKDLVKTMPGIFKKTVEDASGTLATASTKHRKEDLMAMTSRCRLCGKRLRIGLVHAGKRDCEACTAAGRKATTAR
jgi:hypothetical protein